MKTKATVLETFDAPLATREIEIPAPCHGEVLVRVDAAGICGSDVPM